MPNKNILAKIGERKEIHKRIIPDIDSEGHYIGEKVETYEVVVPVMEARTVEMTEEETAEYEALQADIPEPEATTEDRLDEIESAMIELAALMTTEGE